MIRVLTWLFLAPAIFGMGCAHKAAFSVGNAKTADFENVKLTASPVAKRAYIAFSRNDSSGRFIAVRHKLEILSNDDNLPKAWQSVISFCGTIQCEVVTSSITARTSESSASGSIVLRVVPQDYPKLFAQAEKEGNIIEHTTETEDKTSEVVDADAKIKNQSAYRDSLRAMLAKSAKVSDLVEIQEKLTEVQSELDSEAAERKILANQTEKIAVEINFRVQPFSRTKNAFAPIWDAFRDSGANLAESVATLISFLIAILPWLVAITLGVRLFKRLWRRRAGAARRNFA